MRRGLFTPSRTLGLAAAALLLLSQLPPGVVRALTGQPRSVAQASVAFASMPVKYVSDMVRRPADLELDRGGTAEQFRRNYDSLLRERDYYKQELSRAQGMLARYEALRNRPGMKGIRLVEAYTTGWTSDTTRQTLTLSAGTTQGVEVGQTVTDWNDFTLVGRVTDAGPTSATVELITSPRRRLIVYCRPSVPVRAAEPQPMLVEASKSGEYFEVEVKASDPVKVGYLAQLADSSWPSEAQGFAVGKVSAVRPTPKNPLLFNRVVITPTSSLATLGRVLVLVPVGGR